MKAIAFCACTLAVLVSSGSTETVGKQLKHALSIEDNYDTCMTELDLTEVDWFSEPDLINGVYEEPGNEDRRRKNGCAVECLLKIKNLMVGSDIQENKVYEQIEKRYRDNPSKQAKERRAARDCMRKVKDITQECEKGFSLLVCLTKADHKIEKHDEHESE